MSQSLTTKKLIETIADLDSKLESNKKVYNALLDKKKKMEVQLMQQCNHPDSMVKQESDGTQDDYGSWDGCLYWWRCEQCKLGSNRCDWDKHQVRFSRRLIAAKYYKELTGREMPEKKGPL